MRKTIFIVLIFCITGARAQYIKPFFNTLSIINGLPEGYVTASLQDKLGYMWFGTQNGLVRYDGYQLKPYEMPDDDGNPLIYCSIRALHEDKQGKLWAFVDQEGLYYFDRQNDAFEKFKMDESDTNIFKDGFHYKWITDKENGMHWHLLWDYEKSRSYLVAFDANHKKFEKYSAEGSGSQFINIKQNANMLQDAAGQIWLTTDSLLSLFDPSTRSFQPWLVIPDTAKNIKFANLVADPLNQDIIWANPYLEGIDDNKYPYKRKILQINTRTKECQVYIHIDGDPSSIAGNCVNILTDSLNRIWFTTDIGISRFNPADETFTNYAIKLPLSAIGNKTFINSIAADKEGNLWLGGSFNGLYYLDLQSGTANSYSHSKESGSLPDFKNGINKLYYDRSGTLWIGMPWSGIAYLDQRKSMFNPLVIAPSPGDAAVGEHQPDFEIVGRAGDSIFFVTNHTGLFAWNYIQNSYKKIQLTNNDVYRQIIAVLAGANELLWIGSDGSGLFCYNPVNKSVKNFRNDPQDSTSLSSDYISVLTEDKEGNLWIGTNSKGLCSFNKARAAFTRYPFIYNNGSMAANNELDDGTVHSIYIDKEGIIWIGTNQGGLNRLEPRTGKFTSFLDLKSGFNCVINIYEDSQNRLWAGTYLSGLFLFNKNTGDKTRYSEKDGLLFNSVFGIEEDNTGNIWIASARGFSKLEPESKRFSNFPIPVGNPIINHILYKGANGQLNFALTGGLISFNPGKMNASNVPPMVVIESVGYNGISDKDTILYTYGRKLIELQYNENRISFQYVALHYADAGSNQYAYMLEGYDKDWIQAGTQRSATYTNLSPGSYTFRLKAANSDGIWNETGANFIVMILPPWWLSKWVYGFYILLIVAAVFGVDRIMRNRLIQKERERSRLFKLEQAKKIEQAYNELKTTQAQLIQSEKMASLGELTAGIAHEIQNPLNFVNNFSEVSAELVEEMKQELAVGSRQLAEEIAEDIKQNLAKILHHGKRADAIVKGMLQHSRASTGQKELTDINELADEFLRLAYHGLRAKDKSFNATLKTDFDESIGKINIIPQDIGRVILNLITNAFYAVDEKKKQLAEDLSALSNLTGQNSFEPTVSVSTKKTGNNVLISVKDNGNGIPPKVLDKIFQPFFTTKPTGQGTGLGLSLSYDIVKAHGGELKVETKEARPDDPVGRGEGTEFILQLPIS